VEKRELLQIVLSDCTWRVGERTAKYRKPFDVLAVAVAEQRGWGKIAETARTKS
jgi:hypothetical protein